MVVQAAVVKDTNKGTMEATLTIHNIKEKEVDELNTIDVVASWVKVALGGWSY